MSRYQAYPIRFTKTAKKQFDSFNKKIQAEIATVLEEEIATNPLTGKPLHGSLKGLRSFRVGRLRIIYEQIKGKLVVIVIRIEHRKSVYKYKKK